VGFLWQKGRYIAITVSYILSYIYILHAKIMKIIMFILEYGIYDYSNDKNSD